VQQLLDVLNRLDADGVVSEHPDLAAQFILRSCHLLADRFTPSALNALAVADAYWASKADAQALETTRVSCWNELDASAGAAKATAERSLPLRLVLCTLNPLKEMHEPFDAMTHFLDLAGRLADREQQQLALLSEVYSRFL
jgi:hypothetical protein